MNAVSPGLIATAEVRAQLERARATPKTASAAGGGALNSSGRIAEIEEVASLVAFLASDRAGAISADNLRIDSGSSECTS